MNKLFPLKTMLAIVLIVSFFFISLYYPNPQYAVSELRYNMIRVVDKPFISYTEGLVFNEGELIESSGGQGNSAIFSYRPGSTAFSTVTVGKKYFGEGIALLGEVLHVLTWKDGVTLQLSRNQSSTAENFQYVGEGWGLANTGSHFVRSDGSSQLYYHSLTDFKLHHSISVKDSLGKKIDRLNELEYVEGYIWANRWHDTRIYKIDAATGVAVGFVDLKTICERVGILGENVLNGIAWDKSINAFWVTGKNWNKTYLIKIM